MMKIMTEIVKTLIALVHNDGYAQAHTERYSKPVKADS